MDSPGAVDKAIEAHGIWKARLRAAIATGSSEFIVAVVAEPDQCALGKWLHGAALNRFGSHPRYRAVLASHAEFHVEAARILAMAKSSRRADAEAAMADGSRFATLTAELTANLQSWKRVCEAERREAPQVHSERRPRGG
jgi:hypothetical protein